MRTLHSLVEVSKCLRLREVVRRIFLYALCIMSVKTDSVDERPTKTVQEEGN